MTKPKPFSKQLELWLKSDSANTVANLEHVFGTRSFAIIFLLLLALPALPIPTGGITHVLEIICMVLAIEQIVGLKSIWLPPSWHKRPLPAFFISKVLPALLKRIQWVEQYAKPRGRSLLQNPLFGRIFGFFILMSALGAFFAPPFSGMDTLPALGAVLMSLGVLVGDMLFFVVGILVTITGIIVELTVGAALFVAIKKFVLHGSSTSQLATVAVLLLIVLFLVVRHRKK
jgi:hypothetical protein